MKPHEMDATSSTRLLQSLESDPLKFFTAHSPIARGRSTRRDRAYDPLSCGRRGRSLAGRNAMPMRLQSHNPAEPRRERQAALASLVGAGWQRVYKPVGLAKAKLRRSFLAAQRPRSLVLNRAANGAKRGTTSCRVYSGAAQPITSGVCFRVLSAMAATANIEALSSQQWRLHP